MYHATGAEIVPDSFAVIYAPKAATSLVESQQPQTADPFKCSNEYRPFKINIGPCPAVTDFKFECSRY